MKWLNLLGQVADLLLLPVSDLQCVATGRFDPWLFSQLPRVVDPKTSSSSRAYLFVLPCSMRLTMRQRILLAFFAFILGPTLIALVVTQRVTHSLFEDRVLRYSSQLTNQVTRAIDAHLINYRNLSLQLYFNTDLLDAVTRTPPALWSQADVISRVLAGFVNSDRYISTAYLVAYPEDGQYSMDTAIVQGMPYLEVDAFLATHHAEVGGSNGRVVWLPTEELRSVFGRRYNTFAAIRPVRSGDKTVALLVLLFREDFFRERYRDVRLESEEANYLATSQGVVVSSGGSRPIGSLLPDRITRELNAAGSGWFLVRSPKQYYVAHSRSQVTEWAFVSEISRSALLADLVPVRNVMLVIAVLFMGFMAWLGSSVSRRITSPLQTIQQGIHRIGQGDLTVQLPAANDDMGDLAATVNNMVAQLNELLARVSSEEQERQQDRLRFLQMQLSPHFVYNSLNTIRWMAIINHQDNIKTMIDALIKLMKNVASPDAEHTTLSRELSLLRHYAYIQQMRFPNFSLELAVPQELMEAQVNKFVLQNLVENSIVHGFSNRSETGVVRVTAWNEAGDLVVEVQDNGTGFDPTGSPTSQDEEHSHTGLARIQERIDLVHGRPYGIDVASEIGSGTTVRLRVPLKLGEKEETCESRS